MVSYANNGRIVALYFKDWGLWTLPGQIGDLTALDTLDLSFNNLTVLPPSILPLNPKLMINGNRLCDIDTDMRKWIDDHQYCKPGICIYWRGAQDCQPTAISRPKKAAGSTPDSGKPRFNAAGKEVDGSPNPEFTVEKALRAKAVP